MTLDASFARVRADGGRAALIPFVVAGDPSLEVLPGILEGLIDGGADVIELGIPYSDPLADGPTIQAASQRALNRGSTLDRTLALVATLDRSRLNVPLVAFTYYNPLFVRGL